MYGRTADRKRTDDVYASINHSRERAKANF